MNIKLTTGGVCAAKGFLATGVHCGVRKNHAKKDLCLILSEVPASCASVYTLNLVKGAPLLVTKENISDGIAQAIICNSGNANTCNANGIEIAKGMCDLVANTFNVKSTDVVVASTGVIGQPLSLTPIENGMPLLKAALCKDSDAANEGIMTTDLIKKQVAVSFEIDGKQCALGGIAKGSGMIHPNMATMLAFVTTDVKISSHMLQKAIDQVVGNTFNMLSVDGDTSTNDMLTILANGMAGNEEIASQGKNFDIFVSAFEYVCAELVKLMARDGEGATKMLECVVSGGKSESIAKTVAKSVICSSLFKAAMFGADANWGRVLCAIGYSGADVDITKIDVQFKSAKGIIDVCKNGSGVPFDESVAKQILLEENIFILINLNDGDFTTKAWGCDLTYDYVRINGDYRS